MKEPEYVTLLPEESEDEQLDRENQERRKKAAKSLLFNTFAVVILKISTGIAIKNLSRSIREFDILYPESMDRVNWKDSK